MPRPKNKKTSKIAPKRRPESRSVDSYEGKFEAAYSDSATNPTFSFSKFLAKKYLISLALIILLAAAVWKYKSLFVVAIVNNRPLVRWELESRMVSRYGEQTLDEIINEELIRQEGNRKNIKFTPEEVSQKITEVEKSLEGRISLTDALAQQGMSLSEFRQQIELQLILDKAVASSISVTDQEVTEYITKNKDSLFSSDPASQSAEARRLLISQKKNEAYRKLFDELKNQAKISKFL